MFKFIKNFIYVLLAFVMLEAFLYVKDYYDLKLFESYVRYEIRENNFEELNNGKYNVSISYADTINYEIERERDTIFKFYYLKKIKYHGVISF